MRVSIFVKVYRSAHVLTFVKVLEGLSTHVKECPDTENETSG